MGTWGYPSGAFSLFSKAGQEHDGGLLGLGLGPGPQPGPG